MRRILLDPPFDGLASLTGRGGYGTYLIQDAEALPPRHNVYTIGHFHAKPTRQVYVVVARSRDGKIAVYAKEKP